MAKKAVYVEISIVSYLTARPSNNLLAAAWQKATNDWWNTQRNRFNLFVSEIVIEEAGKGDPKAAGLRVTALEEIPLLEITDSVLAFSKRLINEGAVPQKAIDDSLHIAMSVVHEVDYLLTWIFAILITLRQNQLSEKFVWIMDISIQRYVHL